MNSTEESLSTESNTNASETTAASTDMNQSTSSNAGNSTENAAAPESQSTANTPAKVGSGPLNLEQIRKLRESQSGTGAGAAKAGHRAPRAGKPQNLVPPGQGKKKQERPATESSDESTVGSTNTAVSSTPDSPVPSSASSTDFANPENRDEGNSRDNRRQKKNRKGDDDSYTASAPVFIPKVERPNIRQPLSADLESELESALADADINGLMVGDATTPGSRNLEEGSRQSCRIIKIHQDNVFVSLGGPDEGVIPLLQFTDMPQVDTLVEGIIRGFNKEDGLYELAIPGEATSVEDWSDIQEGLVVEATVESSNTGGLECKVGGIRGFIPMRQISEFRVEDAASYIGQRLLCVVLEANPRRGNLVLSHRAILEREKQEKRAERLASLEVGQATEGIVRKVMDFGAFVDIGGLDGLIHISQLSWDKIKHPSEVVNEGDKIQVRVEKIDPETGKIGLSYRSQQDNPWANVESQFAPGTVVKGTVTRIANFGAFVKISTGVEGLIHVSELAHRRIASVASVVQEGQEVEVKILSVDRETQRISLSLKANIAKPESEAANKPSEPEVEEAPRPLAVAKHRGPLKGGTSTASNGERFGLKW